MNTILLGTICGLIFGIIDILVMIPLKYEDHHKRMEAIVAVFMKWFIIGFLIPNPNLGVPSTITGFLLGFGLSLPSAIITSTYLPIIGIGVIGGLIIGFIVG